MEDEIEKGGEALVYAMISEVGTVKQPYGTIKPEKVPCRLPWRSVTRVGYHTGRDKGKPVNLTILYQNGSEARENRKTFTNLRLSGTEKTALTKQIQLETTICNSQLNGKRFRNPGESGYGIKP